MSILFRACSRSIIPRIVTPHASRVSYRAAYLLYNNQRVSLLHTNTSLFSRKSNQNGKSNEEDDATDEDLDTIRKEIQDYINEAKNDKTSN